MPAPLPPATLEGWYALHQIFSLDWAAVRALSPGGRGELAESARRLFAELAPSGPDAERHGWSDHFRLVGKGADLAFLHFRPTLDALAEVQRRVRASRLGEVLRLEYDFLSVTEAGLYYATAQAAKESEPNSEEFHRKVDEAKAAELASAHVQTRLFPRVPEGMRYLSFYPMNKKREGEQNWYALEVAERSRLMRDHGLTGRRYAGKVFQVIGGSVGLDDWEWSVTLFSRDPLEFKRIVTEMRYDEASALYGEFGRFFTGIRFAPAEWASLLEVQ